MKRKNLIRWEIENGYKAKYVAERLGISETAYSLIKNCKTTPSLETAYKFQEEFGIDNVLELLKEEGEKDEKHNR